MTAPKNTTVREGARVKLTCQADGFPSNITYEWLRNDIDVQKVSGLMARAMVYADGSFVVSTVIKEDSGWYKCRPTNGIGPPPEASAYLNVTCKCTVGPPPCVPFYNDHSYFDSSGNIEFYENGFYT